MTVIVNLSHQLCRNTIDFVMMLSKFDLLNLYQTLQKQLSINNYLAMISSVPYYLYFGFHIIQYQGYHGKIIDYAKLLLLSLVQIQQVQFTKHHDKVNHIATKLMQQSRSYWYRRLYWIFLPGATICKKLM